MKKTSNMLTVTIILPCHNEQGSIPQIIRELDKNLEGLTSTVNILYLFVDDGSQDRTWCNIKSSSDFSKKVHGLKLSNNFGHQIALLAGIEHAIPFSDYILTMDADLQHPPEIVRLMIEKVIEHPRSIINAQQYAESSGNVGWFKRISSVTFYKLLNTFGVKIQSRVGDFRLMSSKAASALISHNDFEFFARGLVANLGFNQETIKYRVGRRIAGTSKYSLRRMFRLALQGITSTSIIPLRITFLLSIFLLMVCFFMIINILSTWLNGQAIPGWTTIVVSIYLLFGINFLILGILGEYLGKTYRQVLGRPRYIVEKSTLDLLNLLDK
ncbi:glycosyltransferase family 2 protein [Prochlorococcus sp. MIT 1307]|uniref:glycosyltransferase family 2 protein n=1 Tax=Prochlorococcus sp. MIT 1307 TaxID=3096219 RepID=UPI002A75F800|nr:glycosyltransferase family 2 protein [Prochlorococcus sp. MIT 1307]